MEKYTWFMFENYIDEIILGDKHIKMYVSEEDPWFSAEEISRLLIHYSLGVIRNMVGYVDTNDKLCFTFVSTSKDGSKRFIEKYFVNESGLLDILMQSSREIAKEYRLVFKQIMKERREQLGLNVKEGWSELNDRRKELIEQYVNRWKLTETASIEERRYVVLEQSKLNKLQNEIMFAKRCKDLDEFVVSDICDSVEVDSALELIDMRYSAASILNEKRGIITLFYEPSFNRFIDDDGVLVMDINNYASPMELKMFRRNLATMLCYAPIDKRVAVELKILDESDEGFLGGFIMGWEDPVIEGAIPLQKYQPVES